MRRRVVISGMGSISSAGRCVEEAAASFAAGVCCLSPINDSRVAHLKARYAGLLRDFNLSKETIPAALLRCDKYVLLAYLAAREALEKAAVTPSSYGRRMGLIFSTCSGPMLLIEQHYERVIQGRPQLTSEELLAKRYYSGARALAQAFGIQGLSTTIVTACTASTAAIALATDLVRCGMLDAALAGGSDAFSTSTLAGFDGLKATSEGKCAPFSKPFGLNLGEAAAFVFVEPLEAAKARNASIHAEVAGSGLSNDAYHCSSPEPTGRGLTLAIHRALADSGLTPGDIHYINAHGTGTEANDKAETRAIRKVFGEHAARVPVSSTKSMVGHCLGAAGAIEVQASVLCAERGVFPPTVNFAGPREGCTLDYVPEAGRAWPAPRTFLSSNLAFGGHNASLVISMPGAFVPAPPERACATGICISACGIVSPAGVGADKLAEGVRRGEGVFSAASVAGRSDFPVGFVLEDAVAKFDRRLDLRHMDRSSRLATVAARAAMREAGYAETPAVLAELGLLLALSAGPSWAESEFLTSFLSHDRQVSQLVAFPYIVPSSVAGNVCRALRLTGYNLTLSNGPGAALLAMGPALSALRSGQSQCLLAGAVDELSQRILEDQVSAGLIPEDGVAPGEAAALVLVETEEHARSRGGRVLGRVRGFACSAATAPPGAAEADALAQTILEALSQAGLNPAQVGAFCADVRDPVVRGVSERLSPGWLERLIDAAPVIGCAEGSQPILNLSVALSGSENNVRGPGFVLVVSHSSQSGDAALVVEKAAAG